MQQNKQTFGPLLWSYESEKIERLPPETYSVGVGIDLVAQSGVRAESIVRCLNAVFDQLIDGGANVGFVERTRCYFMRRGKAIEIGTRRDFADLGYAAICDACDVVAAGEHH